MTKKEFKQLRSSGQLLLVTSVFNKTLEFVKNRVNEVLESGNSLYDYASNTTNYTINGKGIKIDYDESNSVIYVYEDKEYNNITVYLMR